MNVTAEQAAIIRATPEGGTAYLVVSADVAGDVTRYWVAPADWAALAGACETCDGLPWTLAGICCGREDPCPPRATYEEQEAIRETYLTAEGHERQAIIGHCPDCVDGRKRTTLTVTEVVREEVRVLDLPWGSEPHPVSVTATVPLATVTVEVLPVVDGSHMDGPGEPTDYVCVYDDGTWERWFVNPDESEHRDAYWLTADVALHCQPVPGRDFVIAVTVVSKP